MLTLPDDIIAILAAFAPLFSAPVFAHVQVLLTGAILTPHRRTVASSLRAMGLAQDKRFGKYHRVLSRDVWSSRLAARILLRLLVQTFAPQGPLVLGIDETLERRQGAKIAAKGIYRDAARSSKSFFVKASGLRWVSLMLLTPVPWAGRVWALPFLTALAPSERYYQERGRRHKKTTDWARQMLLQVRRWLPERSLVVVADAGYAVLGLLHRCQSLRHPVTMVTRLRLDAALYEPAPERKAGQTGRPRKKGERLPTLAQLRDDTQTVWTPITVARWYSQTERPVEIVSQTAVWYHAGMSPVSIRWVLVRDPEGKFKTQALLCTDVTVSPEQIVAWFVQRWQVESTFQEVRTHLGVETQRQWSDKAILRTTPALLGLFSLVALMAHPHMPQEPMTQETIRQAAWYTKEQPTFSDALALVRRRLWQERFEGFWMSEIGADRQKLPPFWTQQITEMLCHTA
jgi:hypothetical protein